MSSLPRVTNISDYVESVRFRSMMLDWDVLIEPAVVQHLLKSRQLRTRDPEVGGQLFGTFEKHRVRISLATGPRKGDRRSRFSFLPDRGRENIEIKQCFAHGLHYIGDWHTHPEHDPSPSSTDLASMADCFRKSKHQLSHFIMLIVGEDDTPERWWLSAHSAKDTITFEDETARTFPRRRR
jgi:integrative and conjugative element protein (TIGR02256 family)